MNEIRKVSTNFQRELTSALELEEQEDDRESGREAGRDADVAGRSDRRERHCRGRRRRPDHLRRPAGVVTTTEEPRDELAGGQMSLIEHLNELRSRLIKCIIAIALGALIIWIFYDPIFRLPPEAARGRL